MRILIIAHLRIGNTDDVKHPYGFLLGFRLVEPLMQLDSLLYLQADLLERVKAGHRVLHNHSDLFAAYGAPFLFGSVFGKVVAVIHYAAAGNGAVLVQHAQKGLCEYRFAGAGLADYGKRFAVIKIERAAAYGG